MVLTRGQSSGSFVPIRLTPATRYRRLIVNKETSDMEEKSSGSGDEELVELVDTRKEIKKRRGVGKNIKSKIKGLESAEQDGKEAVETKKGNKKIRDNTGSDHQDESVTAEENQIDPEFDQIFAHEMVADILNKCRMSRSSLPPRIPLCRILKNEAVRTVNKNDLQMREVFRNDGYLPEKGQFILSLKTIKGNDVLVSESIKARWDDYWNEVNEEFEDELRTSEEWNDLSGKMFLCWDGNHRTMAWMEEIRSSFEFDKQWHVRVSASFIDVEKCHVTQLISALNRINELNDDGVVHNSMKDTLFSVQKIATANPEKYLSKLDPQYLASLKMKENTSTNVVGEQWYSLPRLAYCKMLFQRQMDKEIALETSIATEEDDIEDCKNAATKKVHEKWVQKMGKFLAIVNPQLGPSWFEAVTKADIDTKASRLTVEKLLEMAKAKVASSVRDRWVHWMTSGPAIQSTYGIPKADKAFKDWVRKEVWLEHLLVRFSNVFEETVNAFELQVDTPHGEDLENWFRAFKQANRTNMFKPYQKHMISTVGISDAYEIDKASRRVCYRYYCHLWKIGILQKIPAELSSWRTLSEDGMYSKKGNLDRPGGLSDFEMENCPWWIDFPVGEYPKEEEDSYKSNAQVLTPEVGLSKKRRRQKDDEVTPPSKRERKPIDEFKKSTSRGENEDPYNEFTMKEFDIGSIVSSVAVEIHCVDICQAYEQYSSKIECPSFNSVRDFARIHTRKSHKYTRSGLARDWGFDLVLIDFPTNDLPDDACLDVPSWNTCTTKIIQAAFSFGTLCLDDAGWLVSICAPDQTSLVEKEGRLKCLEKFRTYMLKQDKPFGIVRDRSGFMENACLTVILWSRKGMSPKFQNDVVRIGDELCCEKSILHHRHDKGTRLASNTNFPTRLCNEKSVTFMEFLIGNLSPKEGIVLDMFSGCGNALIASAILSRYCYGLDNDAMLVEHVKDRRLPALNASKDTKRQYEVDQRHNMSIDSDDEEPLEDEEPP